MDINRIINQSLYEMTNYDELTEQDEPPVYIKVKKFFHPPVYYLKKGDITGRDMPVPGEKGVMPFWTMKKKLEKELSTPNLKPKEESDDNRNMPVPGEGHPSLMRAPESNKLPDDVPSGQKTAEEAAPKVTHDEDDDRGVEMPAADEKITPKIHDDVPSGQKTAEEAAPKVTHDEDDDRGVKMPAADENITPKIHDDDKTSDLDRLTKPSGIGMMMGIGDENKSKFSSEADYVPPPQVLEAKKSLFGKVKDVGKTISKKFEDMSPTSKYALAAASGIGAGIGALKLAQKLRGSKGIKK